jgi:hypothetical protein
VTNQRAQPTPVNQMSEDARARRRRGRPSKFTAEVTETILAYLRAGTFPHIAAEAAGVGYSTMRAWLTSGDPAFREFQEAYTRVAALTRADAEQRLYRRNPLTWLKVMARSTPQGDGWTQPFYRGADHGRDGGRRSLDDLSPDEMESMIQLARRLAAERSPDHREPPHDGG